MRDIAVSKILVLAKSGLTDYEIAKQLNFRPKWISQFLDQEYADNIMIQNKACSELSPRPYLESRAGHGKVNLRQMIRYSEIIAYPDGHFKIITKSEYL